MKQQKCKQGKFGFCYDYGDCEDCEINQMILKYEKRIKKLKKGNETLSAELSRYTENIKSMRAEDKKQIETNFAQKIKDEVGRYLYRTNFDGHKNFDIDYVDLCCVIDDILKDNEEVQNNDISES